jgi:hypothetical protein
VLGQQPEPQVLLVCLWPLPTLSGDCTTLGGVLQAPELQTLGLSSSSAVSRAHEKDKVTVED